MRIKTAMIAALCLPGWALAQNAPVAQSATPPSVEATPLDGPDVGAAGLLPGTVTGLPDTLWRKSDGDTLHDLIRATTPAVPALQRLMRVLLLAEAQAPEGFGAGETHLTTRIDWLVARGAVDEALALLDIAGTDTPALFKRWADLNLLLGQSAAPCTRLLNTPRLSTDMSLRIFCTARDGDWPQAALLLQTAETLGDIPKRRADLLVRFLDPELAEDLPPLLPPVRPTPLEFRLFEALGEPLPTAPLPLVFSVLDLSGDNGWRAQIEAAERLARHGALPANRLLGLYSLRRAAASGGVWDRVAALQALESALQQDRPDRISPALEKIWPQMSSARLLGPFSELFGERLSDVALDGRAARMARRAGFLSARYEDLALTLADQDAETRFLTAIARGAAPETVPDLPHAAAVAQAFSGAQPPQALRDQLDQGRLGEVILRAISMFSMGARGNEASLVDALATLRAVGLEDAARRAALEVMLLDAERARP